LANGGGGGGNFPLLNGGESLVKKTVSGRRVRSEITREGGRIFLEKKRILLRASFWGEGGKRVKEGGGRSRISAKEKRGTLFRIRRGLAPTVKKKGEK